MEDRINLHQLMELKAAFERADTDQGGSLDMEEFLDKGMVEPLDKEAEEVELSSLPSLFLLRRELSLSTAATSYTDIF